MDEQRKRQLADDLNDLGRHFWAGEAEVCRAFWSQPRTAEEQAHWLRLQVFKEMYGSGLSASPEGLIRGYLDELRDKLERVDTRADRDQYERELQLVRQEFSHFRLFAETRDPAALESAERDLRTASEQEPERPEILVALANLYRTAGRADEAITAYRRAIEQRPLYAPVYVALASHYEVMGRLAEARENYESALRLNQDLPLAMNNLAWILADAEHPAPEELDRALELASEAKERMPRNPSVADTLGWVMYKRRMSGAAASLFREAIEGYADNGSMRAQVRYHLARTHEAAGQPEQAIEELKRALEDAKEFPGREQAETLLQRLEAAS